MTAPMSPSTSVSPSTSSTRVDYRSALTFVVVVLVLSVLVGGLWVLMSPAVKATVTTPGEGRFDQGASANLFGGVATFAFLTFGLGVVLALASWFGLRGMRGVPGLILTTVTAIVSSGLAMDIGTRIAKAVRPALDENVPGDYELTVRLWFDSDVTQPWLLLICAPAAAVIVYLVCVLTAKNPSLQADPPTPDWQSEWRAQGGEFVGHPQGGLGEGVEAGWAPTGSPRPPDGSGGDDHPAPR